MEDKNKTEIDQSHHKKKKKRKKGIEKVEEEDQDYHHVKKQKKAKKDKRNMDDKEEVADIVIADMKHERKKKKKKAKDRDKELSETQENVTEKNTESHEKYIGSNKSENQDDQEITHADSGKKKRKKDRKKEINYDDTSSAGSIEYSNEIKKKHKKKKKRHIENEDKEMEKVSPHKKSRLIQGLQEEETPLDNRKKKKKKKKHSIGENDSTVAPVTDQELKEDSDSDKAGRSKEHSSRTEPEEKKLSSKKDRSSDPFVGQWGTSALGDDERQQKFLRLLGGFKTGSTGNNTLNKKPKGLFGSLKVGTGTAGVRSQGGHLAMDATQQKSYLSNMEKEYERAMSMNLQRGIGLGFEKPPGEGKKFHIDTAVSKSIKFDDD